MGFPPPPLPSPGGPCGSKYPRGLKGQPFNFPFMLITKFCVIVLVKNFPKKIWLQIEKHLCDFNWL